MIQHVDQYKQKNKGWEHILVYMQTDYEAEAFDIN